MRTDMMILLGSTSPPPTSYILLSLLTLLTLSTRALSLVLALVFRYELVVAALSLMSSSTSPSSSARSECTQIAVINATHGVESGSKKLFIYHGALSWVDDGRDDVRSLDLIQDGPEYFCTAPVLSFYILTVILVTVLPYLITSFLALLVSFKTGVCCKISEYPLLLLSSLLSNLSVSSSGRSHVSVSVKVSCLNLLLTGLTSLPILGLMTAASPLDLHISVPVLGCVLLAAGLVLLVSLWRFSRVSPHVKTVWRVSQLSHTETKFNFLL